MTKDKVETTAASESDAADELFQFHRVDLAQLATGYIREQQSRRQWVTVAAGIAGFVLAPILISIGSARGWPSSLAPFFFGGGLAILLGCGALVFWRASRVRRKYRFPCPACGELLLGGHSWAALQQAQLLMTTGACPHCGAPVCAP